MVSRRRGHPWNDQSAAAAVDENEDRSNADDESSLGNGAVLTYRYKSNKMASAAVEHDNYGDDGMNDRRQQQQQHSHHSRKSNSNSHADEYEVDYKKNPTQLFLRISHRLWDMALARVDSNPAEARAWIVSRYEPDENYDGANDDNYQGDDFFDEAAPVPRYQAILGGIKWRNLPLHLALLHSPHPAPFSLVQGLIQAYPEACRRRNAEGSLPLHLACDNVSLVNNGADGEGVLFALVEAYPYALVEKDGQGRTPVDILERVGRSRARTNSKGESIMYFMRRQMLMQQETKRAKERRGLLGIDDADDQRHVTSGSGTASTPTQSRSTSKAACRQRKQPSRSRNTTGTRSSRKREVTEAAREVVSRRQEQRQARSRSLEPEQRLNQMGGTSDQRMSQDEVMNDTGRSRSVDPSLERRDAGEISATTEPNLNSPRQRWWNLHSSKKQTEDTRQDNDAQEIRGADTSHRKLLSSPVEDAAVSVTSASFDQEDIMFNPKKSDSSLMALRRAAVAPHGSKNEKKDQLEQALGEISSLKHAIQDLRAENTLLHKKNDTSAHVIDDMHSREKNLRKKLDKRDKELKAAQEKNRMARATIHKLDSKHSHDQKQIDECQEETRYLKESDAQKLDAQAKMIDALNDKVTKLKDVVKKNSTTYQKRFDSLKTKAVAFGKDKKELEDKLRAEKEASLDKDRRIRELEEECNQVSDLWQECKDKAEGLEDQLKSVLSDKKGIRDDQISLREQVSALETTREKDNAKLSEMTTQLSASNSQINGLKTTIKTLEAALETKNTATRDTTSANAAIQKRIQDAEAQTIKVEADNAFVRKQLAESKQREDQLHQSVKNLTETISNIEAELDDAKKGRATAERFSADTVAENKTLKIKLIRANEDGVEYIDKIKAQKKAIKDQTKTIGKLEDNVSSIKKANEALVNENDELKSNIESLKASIEDLTAVRNQLETETRKLELISTSMERKVSISNEKIQEQADLISELEAQVSTKEQDIKGMTEANSELAEEILSARSLSLENESLRKAISSMQDVASEYRVKIQEMSSQLITNSNESRAKINALKIAVKQVQKKADKQAVEITQHKDNKVELERTLKGLQTEYSTLQMSALSASDKVQIQTKELDRLNRRVTTLTENLKGAEDERNAVRLERDSVLHKITSLEEKFAEKQMEAECDIDRLEAELVQYKGAKAGVEQALKELQTEHSELRSSLKKRSEHMQPHGLQAKLEEVGEKKEVRNSHDDRNPADTENLPDAHRSLSGLSCTLRGLDLAVTRTITHQAICKNTTEALLLSSPWMWSEAKGIPKRQQVSSRHKENNMHRKNRVDQLLEENSFLSVENSFFKKTLERLQHSLYAREGRALDAERTVDLRQREMCRLIEANHDLKTKAKDLIEVNESLQRQLDEKAQGVIAADGAAHTEKGNAKEMLEKIDTLETENVALKRSNSVLEQALTRLTNRAALHQEKLNELKSRQTSLERKKDLKRSFPARCSASTKASSSDELDKLKQMISKMEREALEAERKRDEAIEDKQNQMKELQTKIDSKEKQISTLMQELAYLQKKAKESEYDEDNTQLIVSSLEKQLAESREDVTIEREQVEKLKQEINDHKEANMKAEGAIKELQKEKVALEESLSSSREQTECQANEINDLNKISSTLGTKIAEMQLDYECVNQKAASLEERLVESLAEVEKKQKDVERLTVHIGAKSGVEQALKEIRAENSTLQKSLSSAAEQATCEKERLLASIAAQEDEKASIQRALDELQTEHCKLKTSLASTSEEIEHKSKELLSLNQKISKLSADLEHAKSETHDLKLERDGMQQKITSLKEELAETLIQAEKECDDNDRLIAELVVHKGKKAGFEEALKELRSEHDTLRKSATMQAEARAKEVNDLNNMVSNLSGKIERAESEKHSLQQDRNDIQQRASCLEQRLAATTAETEDFIDKLEAEITKQKGSKAGVQQALEELKTEHSTLQISVLKQADAHSKEIHSLIQAVTVLSEKIEEAETDKLALIQDRDEVVEWATCLEERLTEIEMDVINDSAIKIQAAWRSYHLSTQYLNALVDIVLVQSAIRRRRAMKRYTSFRQECNFIFVTGEFTKAYKSAVRIQALYRGWSVRETYEDNRYSATLIQSTWRRWSIHNNDNGEDVLEIQSDDMVQYDEGKKANAIETDSTSKPIGRPPLYGGNQAVGEI